MSVHRAGQKNSLWEVRRYLRFCVVAIVLIVLAISCIANAQEIKKKNELGPVKVTTTLSPEKPVIGDLVTLTIEVQSAKDVEVLMPEFGEALNQYSILDFVPRKKINPDGSIVQSQKYSLQPVGSGEQSIPPILIEFVDNRPGKKPAPDDFDAYEILTDRVDFTVQSVVPQNASNELKPPVGELQIVQSTSANSRSAWLIYLSICLVGIAGIVAFFLLRKKSNIVRRSAYEIARTKLDRLLSQNRPKSADEIDRFFVSISAIIRSYLEDRFDLKAPDLTTEEFLELAGRAENLSPEHQGLLKDFLRQADMIKFAGIQANDSDIEQSRNLAIRFLEETRDNSPLIEQANETADRSPDESPNVSPSNPALNSDPPSPKGENSHV